MARAQMAAHRASYPPAQQQQQQQMYSENFFAADMYEYPSAANWTQKAASSLATPPGTAHGHKEPSPYATTANSAFLSTSPYGTHNPGSSLGGMFKATSNGGRARSEDGDSVGESTTGSSHFSSVSDLGAAGMNLSSSPVDHTFAFNMGMIGGALQLPHMGMNMMPGGGMMGMSGMMGMAPPSPPHSVSPSGSQPQSRRPSVNIPGTYAGSGNGSKHASPSHSPGPTPTPSQAHFAGMGLM
ncbi:hypothetical protein M408DRAFT_334059, partial [Serendipita vermifera MAFF 305830]